MSKDIFVICDSDFNNQDQSSAEMLGKAREIRLGNEQVTAVVFGDLDMESRRCLFRAGAQKIIAVQTELPIEVYMAVNYIVELLRKEMPGLVMFPDTAKMKLVAAQTATYIEAGLTADCIDIKRSNDNYVFLRAALSSSVIAEIMCVNSDIQLCTVKRGVFEDCIGVFQEIEDAGREVYQKYISEQEDIKKFVIQPICTVLGRQVQNSLANAKIIFSLGRGVAREDVPKVEKMAKSWGAEVGCTRIMAENGVIDKSRQIGQSGKSVAPELYIAIGISGASQHIVGIHRSKIIIAINRNPEAPIMNYADYGIIRDSKEVIEGLQSIERRLKIV